MAMGYIIDPRGFPCEHCEGTGNHPQGMCWDCDGSGLSQCHECGNRATRKVLLTSDTSRYYCSDYCKAQDGQ